MSGSDLWRLRNWLIATGKGLAVVVAGAAGYWALMREAAFTAEGVVVFALLLAIYLLVSRRTRSDRA